MSISVKTLSDDKICLTLSNFQVKNENLHMGIKRITHLCYVSMQKAINRLIIVLERKNNESDLYITAGRLLADIAATPDQNQLNQT